MVAARSAIPREWEYRNPSRIACHEGDCEEEEEGFEWCVNAPVIDRRARSTQCRGRDIYAIGQGGVLLDRIALGGPLGAAYTPLAIDAKGRVYAQEAGHLFAVGGVFPRRRAAR